PLRCAAASRFSVPATRMRSLSAQSRRVVRALAGMAVARCSTASQCSTMRQSWSGSKRLPGRGSAPSWRSRWSFSGDPLMPAATGRGTTGRPTAPVAPATKTFMPPLRQRGALGLVVIVLVVILILIVVLVIVVPILIGLLPRRRGLGNGRGAGFGLGVVVVL